MLWAVGCRLAVVAALGCRLAVVAAVAVVAVVAAVDVVAVVAGVAVVAAVAVVAVVAAAVAVVSIVAVVVAVAAVVAVVPVVALVAVVAAHIYLLLLLVVLLARFCFWRWGYKMVRLSAHICAGVGTDVVLAAVEPQHLKPKECRRPTPEAGEYHCHLLNLMCMKQPSCPREKPLTLWPQLLHRI